MAVADVGGKEFDETLGRLGAACGDERGQGRIGSTGEYELIHFVSSSGW
jgi:hypothetical protein